MMNFTSIAHARLASQQVTATKIKTIKSLVDYMCAIQAQDFSMARWAIGLRLTGSTEKKVIQAFDKGDILRAHVLRPTWHLVAAADIYWLQAVSKDKIKALMRSNDKLLDLDEKIFSKSNVVIEKCLQDGNHVTRDTIAGKLLTAKIRCNENRLSHLLMRAELEGIACSGKLNGNLQTYSLLEKRVPKKKVYVREECLALLAKKYFASRGPASLQDFTWWSGLSITESRHALESVKSQLVAEKIKDQLYWLSHAIKIPPPPAGAVHLLPAFDEFIVSYKDRTAALPAEHNKKLLTTNGIFYPAVVVNSQVTGVWKRLVQKDQVTIEAKLFKPATAAVKRYISKEAALFAAYAGKKNTVINYI